eukprot:4557745-Pyramimonas_sp.AAC.1
MRAVFERSAWLYNQLYETISFVLKNEEQKKASGRRTAMTTGVPQHCYDFDASSISAVGRGGGTLLLYYHLDHIYYAHRGI